MIEGTSETPLAAPEPIEGLRNLVLVVLDSCRYDTLVKAKPANILRLGQPERRWSYASWTGPSHYNLLTGLLPHSSPQNVFASEYYKQDLGQFGASRWTRAGRCVFGYSRNAVFRKTMR